MPRTLLNFEAVAYKVKRRDWYQRNRLTVVSRAREQEISRASATDPLCDLLEGKNVQLKETKESVIETRKNMMRMDWSNYYFIHVMSTLTRPGTALIKDLRTQILLLSKEYVLLWSNFSSVSCSASTTALTLDIVLHM